MLLIILKLDKIVKSLICLLINHRDSDTSPLLASDRMVESLSEEIDVLLQQLSQVNNDMTEISTATPGLATRALVHTLQRHRDILQDYTQEFRKTRNNLKSRREREELLTGVKNEIEYEQNYTCILVI